MLRKFFVIMEENRTQTQKAIRWHDIRRYLTAAGLSFPAFIAWIASLSQGEHFT